MITISGPSPWAMTIRRESCGAVILRAATPDRRAVLPETLLGLPVIALGDHALTPEAPPVEGEAVRITCGPADPSASWDNRDLEDLTLPPALERVEDYAFFNCAGLRTLRLHDGIRRWGGGALMNCRLLHTIHLTRTGAPGETLAYFADELSRELDVTIRQADGQTVRLLFPEYVELYEENCPAHHFDYNIYGAGYPYHHCFRRRQLDLREYDRLWPGYLATEHDSGCALRLALYRLRNPAELSEEAEDRYASYLRAHGAEALRYALEAGDVPSLAFLLERIAPDRDALSQACAAARAQGASEALALLLEAMHRRDGRGAARFAL